MKIFENRKNNLNGEIVNAIYIRNKFLVMEMSNVLNFVLVIQTEER